MQHVTTSKPINQMPSSPDVPRKFAPFPKPSRPIPPSWADDVDSPVVERRSHPINFGAGPNGASKFQSPPLVNHSSPSTSPDNSMSSDGGSQANANANARWTVNSSGQVVDSGAEWLADDLVRLQIAGGGSDDLQSVSGKAPSKTAAAHLQEHLGLPNHTRGSSADSTSSHVSAAATANVQKPAQLKVDGREGRDRPHSYSGGLSTADLRRLQTAGGPEPDQGRNAGGTQEKGDQTTFPSLAGNPRQASSPDLQVDYNAPQRQFQPISIDTRVAGNNFRSPPQQQQQQQQPQQQQNRAFNPQGSVVGPNAVNMPFPMQPGLALGANPQDVYNMMAPSHENPAIARVQQQHNVFRNNHQHSTSDPAHLRDAAAAALISAGMPFAPGLYPLAAPPAVGLYPGQFFAPQEAYAPGVAQIMAAARMQQQQQFPQPYAMGMPSPQLTANAGRISAQGNIPNMTLDAAGNGPSANNRKLGLYKTELCRSWEEKGTCRYGPKCQFAHGEDELRKVARHPKYKTEICRTFWVSGSCPYGKRCCFIHTELPPSGPPGADGTPPPKITQEGRPRSDSDSGEQNVSLLQRISAKRSQDASPQSSTGETTPSTSYPTPTSTGPRQPLRVDTASLDPVASMKHQNKSAFPTFATNGTLFRADEGAPRVRSPGPVTAGPELSKRIDFSGFTNQSTKQSNRSSNSSVRHSFNGTEAVNLGLNATTPPSEHTNNGSSSPFGAPNLDARAVGHARSGSAGNWGTLAGRGVQFQGPQTAAPGNEPRANVPWLSAVDGPGTGGRW